MVDVNHPWEEEFRPTKIEDVLGAEHLVDKFSTFINDKSIPNLYFVGPPGTGKTTVAKILAKEIAGEDEYLYISASDTNDINTIRTNVKDYCYVAGINDLKVIVLDEADFITQQAQAALRNVTEDFKETCRFIMTANYDNKIIAPLKSRFQKFEFEKTPQKEICIRCAKILKSKGVTLNEQAKKDLTALVKHFYPDIRTTINNMQKFTSGDKFAFNIGMVKSDSHEKFVALLRDGKISTIRKDYLGSANDHSKLFRVLYDNVNKLTDSPDKMGQIIVTIANYQYMHSLVADTEINFVACLFEIFNVISDED